MASLDDLKNVLRETLEQKGVLNEVKAKIRAEVFTALDSEATGKPPLSNENMIINEMIREYLEYNRYYNSSSVLVTESGQPVEPPFDREYLHKKFAISSAPKGGKPNMPLLYEIIFGLKPEMAQQQEEDF
jgi:lisH domain-containing protein FOPNL